MRGFFFLEAAKEEMGVAQAVEAHIAEAQSRYQIETDKKLRHVTCEAGTLWHKLDHLLYLPVLGLERPRCLYYYQGEGLEPLYGFTYKYFTLEHFLGQLTRMRIGFPLANTLAQVYAQAWYPGQEPLYIFTDWHVKPHWTKEYSHSGHVTMWGRTMPGTRQLIINGPKGYFLGGWNYPIDTHMTQVLVDLEEELGQTLQRPIICNVLDGEAGGQPIAERYAESDQGYLSVLSRHHDHPLADFSIQGTWIPVIDDPDREVAFARWANPSKAAKDPRRFVLMRPVGQMEPTRIYTGLIPEDLPADLIPWLHRRRWPNNELRIRELINGANLNQNYGYLYAEVSNRTRQRQWERAQARVEVTQNKLLQRQEAVHNLRCRLEQLQHNHILQLTTLRKRIAEQRLLLGQRERLGRPTRRCRNQLLRLRRELADCTRRFCKRQCSLSQQLHQHHCQSTHLQRQLADRTSARDAIDTQTLCRERLLEKDQIMLDLQILLNSLHDWAKLHYFAPAWQKLTLETATHLIYRKPGYVSWHPDRIEVILDPYRHSEHQRAMEITCQHFNDADLRWRDGRRLRILVQQPNQF
jgi:hypothetical protein